MNLGAKKCGSSRPSSAINRVWLQATFLPSLNLTVHICKLVGGCVQWRTDYFPKCFLVGIFQKLKKKKSPQSPQSSNFGNTGWDKVKQVYLLQALGTCLLLCIVTLRQKGRTHSSSQTYLMRENFLGTLSYGGVVLWNGISEMLDWGICRIPFSSEEF